MDYYCKYIDPRDALQTLGFRPCQYSAGYEIALEKNKNGFPLRRMHAIVVENRVSIHYDKQTRKHRHASESRDKKSKTIYEAVLELDRRQAPFFTKIKWRINEIICRANHTASH